MQGRIQRRLTAWLALVAAMLLCVAPSRGLVLCFEPDGTIALESAGAGRACDGCDDPAAEKEALARVVAPVSACCECLDIPVDGTGDEARVPPAAFELLSMPLALAPEFVVAGLAPSRSCSSPWRGPPGSASALAQLRTVVLRV